MNQKNLINLTQTIYIVKLIHELSKINLSLNENLSHSTPKI